MEDNKISAEDVIIPLEDIDESLLEEQEQEQEDFDKIEINSVIGVLPLEPVVVIVSIEDEHRLGDMKTIGIPGFINTATESFFYLDGCPPKSQKLKEKIQEYIRNR